MIVGNLFMFVDCALDGGQKQVPRLVSLEQPQETQQQQLALGPAKEFQSAMRVLSACAYGCYAQCLL